MTGDYSFYITLAYGLCFAVLSAVTLSTVLAWKKIKKELDE